MAGLVAIFAQENFKTGLIGKLLNERLDEHRSWIGSLDTSTSEFLTILDHFTDVFYITDNAGKIRFISGAVHHHLGYDPEEMIDRPMSDFYLVPEDREKVITAITADPGKITNIEFQLRHKDGGITWASTDARVILDIDGTPLGVEGVSRDITDRKLKELALEEREAKLRKSEIRHRRLVENSPDILYSFSDVCGGTYYSPRVVDILGHSAASLREHPRLWHDSIHPEDLPTVDTAISDLRDGRAFDLEYRIRDAHGKWVWLHDRNLVTRREGDEVFVEGLATDITARKIAEEAQNRSRKLEAVGQLTGGIAHDYNNMLAVIIGNIQMVARAAELDDKSKQRLDRALTAAQRNADLTAKLLGFSRTQPHRTEPICANDSIEGLEDVIAKSLTASIEVRTNLSEDLWFVDIDPAELEDMLLNLAINSRDAMPDGGVLAIATSNKVLGEDCVSYNPGSHTGEYVVVAVSDTGTGMSKEVREKIFDPFFSTKEMGKGTGLGLSMVYAFVQRSGGFINVHSVPREGTTFRVFLPRVQCRADSVTAPNKAADQELSRGSETILVVDDEELLVNLVVTQFEDLGYRTFSADSGEEALEILKGNPNIDLLFSDIIMPGKLDGYDLALAAKKICPSLEVLLTSGFAGEREEFSNNSNEIVARLAAKRLSKPYVLAELAIAIRNTLDEKGLKFDSDQREISSLLPK